MIKIAASREEYDILNGPNESFICYFKDSKYPQIIIHNREETIEYWAENHYGGVRNNRV